MEFKGDLPIVDKVETGNNIRRLMRLNHYSISQLQLILKMSSATQIYAWCRGEYLPSPDRLLQLAHIFNCHIDDLLITGEQP